MTWWQGYEFCRNSYYINNETVPPYLAEIFSQEQQDFITETIVFNDELFEFDSWWIGLRYSFVPAEGLRWRWFNSKVIANFTAWSPDYPTNGRETVASMVRDLVYEWIPIEQPPLAGNEDDVKKSYPICQFIPL